jgi:hypothetical protein
MSHVPTSRSVRMTALAAAVVIALAALSIVGCGTVETPGGPSGNGVPASMKVVSDSVRSQALDEMRALGFTFDPSLVSVRYGNTQTRLIVTGPLTGPASAKLSAAGVALKAVKVKYTEIDLSMQGGAWAVVRTKLQ